VVREADFDRAVGCEHTPDQRGVRVRVVGAAERAFAPQARPGRSRPATEWTDVRFERFVERQRRQECRRAASPSMVFPAPAGPRAADCCAGLPRQSRGAGALSNCPCNVRKVR